MRKIAIYCRVSTDEQARNKEGSITSQVQRLQLKTDEKNRNNGNKKWGKVVHIYKDEAYSGKNTNRPELQKMLSNVKSKRIDTVMVTELSRLSRSVTDFLNFVQELEEYGCDFICLQYDFDTTSPVGKVFMTIIMALAQFERELTAERIKNNFYARALRGLSNGGSLFLGYEKDPNQAGKLIVKKEEAAIVRDIFNLYLQAGGLAEVAHSLNERGLKNKAWVSKRGHARGGKPFCIDALWRILTNYGYIGKREVNKTSKHLSQNSLKAEERYSLVDATWEAVIDPETFKTVQEKLNANKRIHPRATYDFLFSGLLICDECGAPLCGVSGTSRGKKHFYYGHARKASCRIQRYNAQKLERLIKKKLFDLFNNDAMSEQFIEALKMEGKEQSKTTKILLEAQKREAETFKIKTEKLVKLVTENPLAKEVTPLLNKIQENEKHFAKLKEEIQVLEEKTLVENKNKTMDVQFILSHIDKLRKDTFRKAKISKKKSILRNIIKGIHIHPENIIRLDLWANETHPKNLGRNSQKQAGVVLPFHKLGRPLEASFSTEASGGAGVQERYKKIKKAVGWGDYALCHHEDNSKGFLEKADHASSYRFGSGTPSQT